MTDPECKYPSYGRELAERQHWNNRPMFVYVCLGNDAFQSAEKHTLDRDKSALVLTPGQDPKTLKWPVSGCPVVIEWNGSASETTIIELVKCLLKADAISVTVWPTFVDHNEPQGFFDTTKPLGNRWVQSREAIRIYFPTKKIEVKHAA